MRNDVQKRLLTKADLTFTKALEAAEIAERAARDAEQLQSGLQADNPADVHQVHQPWQTDKHNKGATNCYRCGGNHA